MSYPFSEYFTAALPRWVQLFNREDGTDPVFTAFLRAGTAKVLLEVTPKNEVAVQHFLETRELWEGVDADLVIDDPLFDEVRGRTDDRSAGTPVGEPWTYAVPTSLVCLHKSDAPLPDLDAERGSDGTPNRRGPT